MTDGLIFIAGSLAGAVAFWVGDGLADIARRRLNESEANDG